MTMPLISVPKGLQTGIFVLGEGALSSLPELLKTEFLGKSAWIVADENTWEAAGSNAQALLRDAGIVMNEPYIFPGTPRLHPHYSLSQMLAEMMPENCVPLAIGSGVINDLVKCASGIRNVRYCCVPTACSVDGYTSSGGAMVVDGLKKTVPCPAPYAICADTDILKSAPAPMFASGYADLLTKIPAGGDWIIAAAIGVEPIRQDVWQLIQSPMRKWVSDSTNMMNVFEGLAATGYSMQMYHDSRPASGAEHLFSHVWEMEGVTLNGEDVSHGFKVGVGLLASTTLMEYIIQHDIENLKPRMLPGLTWAQRESEIERLLIRGCYGAGVKEVAQKKFLEGAALAERRNKIISVWPDLQKKLKEQLFSYEQCKQMLLEAHCPVTAAEIGLEPETFLHAIPTAQLIRNRYTVLDLLYEMGLLQDATKYLARIIG